MGLRDSDGAGDGFVRCRRHVEKRRRHKYETGLLAEDGMWKKGSAGDDSISNVAVLARCGSKAGGNQKSLM